MSFWISRVVSAWMVAISLAGSTPSTYAAEVLEGRLIADQVGNISSQMTGERTIRIDTVRVRKGDRVKKGDLLAQLNTQQLVADRLVVQRALEEAEAQVGVAQSTFARARLEYARQSGLKGSPSFNRAVFENSEVALKAAESALNSARINVKRRQAEIARIDLEINFARILAPYDGIVLEVFTNVGAAVTQKNPDLMKMLDLSQVEIEIDVSTVDVARFRPGQRVAYSIDGGPKRSAQVRAILPRLADRDGRLTLRLSLDSDTLPADVRHQMPVEVYAPQ